MNIKDIKQVSNTLTLEEIQECVSDKMSEKENLKCEFISFDDLIKAEYVRSLMEAENMKQNEAIRKLASNIRKLS